jgi:UDP-3-O-[3-hydroxymyristoyl] glucosamine N-acyltransferase
VRGTAPVYTVQQLATLLGLELDGDPSVTISGIAPLGQAGPDDISFYHNSRYHADLLATRAAAVILRLGDAATCPAVRLISKNPYAAYARLTQLFAAPAADLPGRHPSVVVDPSAEIAASAVLGPHVVVGAGTVIGARVRLDANVVVGADCRLGEDSHVYPNVSVYDGVDIGKRALIHSGVVLGSDGFGFAPEAGRNIKIAQLGGLRIGDDVEIGAGTSIDRGALEDTVIGNGVKIDNQVQIAHNVKVGDNTVICGCSAIAGSSVIGKNCIIAGAVGVINHVTICDGVTVTAMSLVNQPISEPGIYSSGTGMSDSASWRKNIVRFRQLDELWKRMQQIERQLVLLDKDK